MAFLSWSPCPLWNSFFCTQHCLLCLFLFVLSAVFFTFVSSIPPDYKLPSGCLDYWSYLSLPLFFCIQKNSVAYGKNWGGTENCSFFWYSLWWLVLLLGWAWNGTGKVEIKVSYLLTHMDISKMKNPIHLQGKINCEDDEKTQQRKASFWKKTSPWAKCLQRSLSYE